MPFKTTVKWLFIDMWGYLVIACFDWKIAVFRQTVVYIYLTTRVHYIFNLGETKIGMGFNQGCFGIGFNVKPYVGWYIKSGGAHITIPGTAYLLGKIFIKFIWKY